LLERRGFEPAVRSRLSYTHKDAEVLTALPSSNYAPS
jgi:hypothetical protein